MGCARSRYVAIYADGVVRRYCDLLARHITLWTKRAMISFPEFREEVVMLQRYFIRPNTIDRIRASWIGEPIEQYVAWLDERGYAARNVFRRVPILVQFGEFAKSRGANNWNELPD